MEQYTFSEESLKAGRALFSGACDFVKSVLKIEDLPPIGMPEITFAGRSNVGKSSLINALTKRKGLAKTSNTPGRTQCLNYFNVQSQFFLVDMPGYGYAEAPKKLVEEWQGLIREYLLGRPTLLRVFLLIDSRHGIKQNDLTMMKMLDECAVSYQIVLTKVDKIGSKQAEAVRQEIIPMLNKHPAAHPFVHMTSSEKGLGMEQLYAEVAMLVG